MMGVRVATRVYLVRHGQTEWNAERRIQGQLDVPLSPVGHQQAESAADALAGEPLAAVYASDLRRAWETATPIAGRHGLPVIQAPALREAGFGEWEGLSETEIVARYPEEYRLWRSNSLLHRPPGGETIADLQRRAACLYERVLQEHAGQSVVLVGHGGSIRALVLYAIGAPLDAYPRLRMRNASITLIEVGDDGPVLALYDHVCFLALL